MYMYMYCACSSTPTHTHSPTHTHTPFRYDYLEFTDSQGVKTKFDGEYGSSRWAKRMEFKGQKLGFRFHSDGSNNEWGYKFTVSGCDHVT